MASKTEEGFPIMVNDTVQHELAHIWFCNGRKFFTEKEAMSYRDSFVKRNKRMTAEEMPYLMSLGRSLI